VRYDGSATNGIYFGSRFFHQPAAKSLILLVFCLMGAFFDQSRPLRQKSTGYNSDVVTRFSLGAAWWVVLWLPAQMFAIRSEDRLRGLYDQLLYQLPCRLAGEVLRRRGASQPRAVHPVPRLHDFWKSDV